MVTGKGHSDQLIFYIVYKRGQSSRSQIVVKIYEFIFLSSKYSVGALAS